ncbi:MAG: alpha-N-acetylglucosaminidase C-terminal domain-containing protein, partial [Odoribacter sp.]|nr:alpha-N-acetylglucosaminidase C-terminal domain-containing protein [Odoribacter sp.]
EWNGLLKDFYYPRWKTWFAELQNRLSGETPRDIDWYALEEPWTRQQNDYAATPQEDPVRVAGEVFREVFGKR